MSEVCQVEGVVLGIEECVPWCDLLTLVLDLWIVPTILPILMATVGPIGSSVLSEG